MVSSLLSFGDLLHDVTSFFTKFDDLESAATSSMVWIGIALALGFVLCKFIIKKDKQPLVNRIFAFIALAYAVTSIVLFAAVYFLVDVGEDEEFAPMIYYPMLTFAIVATLGIAAILIKPLKPVKIAAYSSMGAALIAVIVCLIVYYSSGEPEYLNGVTLEVGQNVALYIGAAVITAAIALSAILIDRDSRPFDSRSLSFAAVCIAMSFALSYIRFFKMPFGGSITFVSTLPLMLYSYMFGIRKGALAGMVCGILQAIQDPWILHPAQFLLDYPVAFAGIGLAGILRNLKVFDGRPRLQFSLGAAIAGAVRFISHFVSGALAFGSYGAGYVDVYGIAALSDPYFYSFLYQLMYVIPDALIVIIAGILLFSSNNFKTMIARYTAEGAKKTASAQPSEGENTAETPAADSANTPVEDEAPAADEDK